MSTAFKFVALLTISNTFMTIAWYGHLKNKRQPLFLAILVSWLIDFFLIPLMDRRADRRYLEGPWDYTITWILLTFLGVFGVHRFYMNKWFTGVLYLLTGGLFFVGWLYDLWTLNEQVDELNRGAVRAGYGR